MRILHIITVGTSIVRNVARVCDSIYSLKRYCEVLNNWARALPDSAEDIDAYNNAVPSSPIYSEIREYVASDPFKPSAELNAFLSYLSRLASKGLKAMHDVILYSSDSGVCWFCTRIIDDFLRSFSGYDLGGLYNAKEQIMGSVKSIRVHSLGRDFHSGLLNLIVEIKKTVVREASKYDLIVANLTAGFKPESGMVILTAGLIGIDRVYYIHEYMREVVEIPIIPLEIPSNLRYMLRRVLRGYSLTKSEKEILGKMGLIDNRGRVTPWAREWIKIMISS